MDSIEQAYLQIILEAQYETDVWKRYGEYKEIVIYYNIEHIKQRLLERYSTNNFGDVRKKCKQIYKNYFKW